MVLQPRTQPSSRCHENLKSYKINIFVFTRLLTHNNLTNSKRVYVAAVECLSEFGQQDSEYTEDYASVTQRQLNSLTEQIVPTEPSALAPVPKPRYVPHMTKKEDGYYFVHCFTW
jgi:hypothetical protein